MKRLKKGFTLAEVLITLSIIGIVAAIVMPGVISSYQYKAVGVKLSKFISTTEDASRAYVVQNDTFETNTDVMSFLNEAYLIKSLHLGAGGSDKKLDKTSDGTTKQDESLLKAMLGSGVSKTDYPSYYTVKSTNASNYAALEPATSDIVALLKDGTAISVKMVKKEKFTDHKGIVDSHKVGLPVFNINFDPIANGLPSTVQKRFNFVVTELGYVFPNDDDDCLWDIYDSDWVTNAKTFNEGSSCNPDDSAS